MKKFVLLTSALLSLFTARLEAQVILQDSFTYANGLTVVVSSNAFSSGLWTNYSGTSDSTINNGRLEVFGTRFGDIYRPFTNTLSSSVAYASFIVNSTNVLTLTSNYFAHFSANSTTFRGRVWTAPGKTPNTWRLGITAGASAGVPRVVPLDLATNVDYRVVISYDTGTFGGTLWIDPVDPTDFKAQSNDSTTAATLGFFSFRQASQNQNLRVDELYVGNSFADVAVGTPKPATVYYQPPAGPTTVFTGNNFSLSCVGGGAGTVTFQWLHAGTNLVDDANNTGTTSNVLSLVSAVTTQSGDYRCIVISTTNSVLFGSVTSSVAQVNVSAAPVPPTFITQPVSQTLYKGQNAVFSTTVSSPGNVSYQWYSNNVVLVGETASTLTLNNVVAAYAASYKVAVTNDVVVNGIVSTNAVLTVINPPVVSIAYLRTLVDPATFQSTNVPALLPYQVTGIVTTFTNLTGGNNTSYYLQDATAGINIFATFASTFRPQQGDVVTFVGVVSSFSIVPNTGGLELFADTVNRTYTSYSIVSNNFPLPIPRIVPFSVTNTYGYAYMATNIGGSRVTLTNVYFGTNFGNAILAANQAVTVTNAGGEAFILRFFATDPDTAGQIMPAFATSVTGVMVGNHPEYSLAVTKFSDIVVPPSAPIPLGLSYSGGTLTFNWTDASFSLQSATNVLGPYTTVTGAATGFTTNTTSDQMYFRLFHP